MRKSRVVAGLVAVGTLLALAFGSATVAAGAPPAEEAQRSVAAPARADQGSVELASGRGVKDFGDYWYMHGSDFEFSVTAGAASESRSDGATVFVSWPAQLRLLGSTGESWSCAEVEGGVECVNPAVVEPGRFWPVLTLNARGTETVHDTIDAYLRGVGGAEAHAGVPFTFDTSS